MRRRRALAGGLRLAATFLVASVAVPALAQESSGFAGLQVQPADAVIRQALGAEPKLGGIMVRDVAPAGPGEAAGLERGDLLLAVQGVELTGLTQLVAFMKATKPDQTVKFQVWRDGVAEEKAMQLTSWPAGWDIPTASKAVIPKLGIVVEALTAEVRAAASVRWGRTGLLVTAVSKDSLAASYGLRPGDRITAVGRVPIVDPAILDRLLGKAGDQWYLLVERSNEVFFIGPGAEPPPETVAADGSLVAMLTDGLYLMDRTVEGSDHPIGSKPEALPERESEVPSSQVVLDDLGLTVAALSLDIRADHGARWSSRGSMVIDVKPGSAAQLSGLRVGQVISEVNQTPTDNPAALRATLSAAQGSHAVLLVEETAGYSLLKLDLSGGGAAPAPPPPSFQWPPPGSAKTPG